MQSARFAWTVEYDTLLINLCTSSHILEYSRDPTIRAAERGDFIKKGAETAFPAPVFGPPPAPADWSCSTCIVLRLRVR